MTPRAKINTPLYAPFLAVVFLFACAFPVTILHAAEPVFPALSGRVIDNANLLSAEDESQLVADLEAHAVKSTDQVVVVTLPSLQGLEIEDFGYRLGRYWGIGQAKKDNGALLIIAPKERKVRIEVGRGLEPILTDAVTRLIIENGILPRFRGGDVAGGVRAGVTDILAVLSGDAQELAARSQAERIEDETFENTVAVIIVFIWLIIFIIVAWSIIQSVRQGGKAGAGSKTGSGGWSWGSGGSSGGGWSSGGGGFSGGGGSFGGGGSSGSW